MTRRKWTTTEQEEWLKSRLAGFADAQVNKTTSKEFFPAVLKDWRTAWPSTGRTAEEITQAGSIEKATQKKKAEEDNRIKTWFHNHTRGATSGAGARGLLKMKGKQKTLQEWQVYHVMTYESQWKPVVDAEWEKYKSAWEVDNPGKELDETRFTFMTSFMRQKYQDETEDVKNKVKKRREELKEELERDGEEKNIAYQNAINRLPRTLAVWGESIKKQTGWNISFLVGGPTPRQNGQINTYVLHCGKSPEGEDFEAFLGEDGYDKHIITPFDDFLHDAFPPDVCNSRSLDSKASTPEVDENERRNRESELKDTASGNGEDNTIISVDPGSTSANRGKSRKSEYELTREANIAKNKELLRDLGLQFGWGDETEKVSEKKGKKGKKEQKEKQAPSRSSPRTGASTSTSTSTSSEDKPANEANGTHQVEGSPMPTAGGQSAVEPHQTLSTNETALSTNETGGPLPSDAHPLKTSHSVQLETPSADGTAAPAESTAPDNKDSPPQEPNQDLELARPPTCPAVTTTQPAPLADNTPEPRSPMSALPASSTATIPTAPTPTKEDLGSMEVDMPGSATDPTSNPDPIKDDEEMVNDAPAPPSSTVAVVPAPAWLTALKMDVYFQECSDVKAWQGLVQALYKFEEMNTINGNLPTTSHPEEVASWIKSKKKNTPPDVNADSYGSSFMAWWITLQPRWRLAEDGSFNYEAPNNEDWRVLHKGGKAGLYTVVVALSWWVRALTPDIPSFRAWTAVRDVQWVINQISTKITPTGKKRPLEDSGPSTKSKKGRRS